MPQRSRLAVGGALLAVAALIVVLWWQLDAADRPERTSTPEAPPPADPDAQEPAPTEEHARGHGRPDDSGVDGDAAYPDARPDTPSSEGVTAERALPPDPPEKGKCKLELECVDAATGDRIASWAWLWRLDAPNNEYWSAGDQLYRALMIPESGAAIPGLPAGRYRVVCGSQRVSAEDPPPFPVNGAFTRRTFRVSLPQERKVFLKVYDETGRLLSRGEWSRWTRRRPRRYSDPEWLRRRVSRGGRTKPWGRLTSAHTERLTPRRLARASDRGFDLGGFGEADKQRTSRNACRLEFEGRGSVNLTIRGHDLDRNRTYVAVCPLLKPVRDRFFLADGRSAAAAGATIEVISEAVLDEEGGDGVQWRSLPITVTVSLKGFQETQLVFSSEKPLSPEVLRPVE